MVIKNTQVSPPTSKSLDILYSKISMQGCLFMFLNVHVHLKREQIKPQPTWAETFRKYAEELPLRLLFEAQRCCIAIVTPTTEIFTIETHYYLEKYI